MVVRLDNGLSESTLRALHGLLAARPEIQLALVFGSYARKAARPDSDIDLAIVAAPEPDLLELRAALTRALGIDADVVSLRDPTIPLLEELIRDSVVVYERTEGAGALWRSRTLASLETDRPWFARMREAWLRRVAERGL